MGLEQVYLERKKFIGLKEKKYPAKLKKRIKKWIYIEMKKKYNKIKNERNAI